MPGTASFASASTTVRRSRRSSRRQRHRSLSPPELESNNHDIAAAPSSHFSRSGDDDRSRRLLFDWPTVPSSSSAHDPPSRQYRSKSLPALLRLSSREEQQVWLSGMLRELSFWESTTTASSSSPSSSSKGALVVDSASLLLKSLEQRQEEDDDESERDSPSRQFSRYQYDGLSGRVNRNTAYPNHRQPYASNHSMLSSSRPGLASGPSQRLPGSAVNSDERIRNESAVTQEEDHPYYHPNSIRQQECDEEKKVEGAVVATTTQTWNENKSAAAPVTPLATAVQRVWKSAVDPSSGRTYYYDAVTRQTQWEKPEEVRAEERRIKKEKRRLELLFFDEVRVNVLASLERGELIPGIPRREVHPQGPPLEPIGLSPTARATAAPLSSSASSLHYQTAHDSLHEAPTEAEAATEDQSARKQQLARRALSSNSNARVRTISGMNEKLLAELHNPALTTGAGYVPAPRTQPTTSFTAVATANEGRPPLPRGRSQTYREDRATSTGFAAQPVGGLAASLHPPPMAVPPSDHYFAAQDSLELSPDTGESLKPSPSIPPHAYGDHAELEGERLLDGPIFGGDPPSGGHPPLSSSSSSAKPSLNTSTAPLSSLSPSSSHVRRNTGGTVFVQSTMENPDVNATIKCVCGVFRAHIVSSCASTTSSPLGSEFDVFQDETSRDYHARGSTKKRDSLNIHQCVPSLQEIENFYLEFFRRSQMEQDTIIMSLIYVERLIKETNGRLTPSPYNWKSILFSCMVLSSKVWDDLSMFNLDFSNVSVAVSTSSAGTSSASAASNLSAFSLQRTNALEVALLQTLNFNVRVAASEYAKYYFLIRTMLIRSGLLDERGGSAASKNAGGQLLENRSSRYQDQLKRRAKSVDWTFGASSSLSEPVLKETVCLEQLLMSQRS